jgi:hypothetical protein
MRYSDNFGSLRTLFLPFKLITPATESGRLNFRILQEKNLFRHEITFRVEDAQRRRHHSCAAGSPKANPFLSDILGVLNNVLRVPEEGKVPDLFDSYAFVVLRSLYVCFLPAVA